MDSQVEVRQIKNLIPHYSRKNLLQLSALIPLYALLQLLSLKISATNSIGDFIWLPSGIAFAALLLYGPRLWPGVLIGALLGARLAGDTLTTSAIAALGNTLDPLLGTWLLTRVVKDFDIRLMRQSDLWWLILCAGVVGTLPSTLISAPMYLASSNISPSHYAHLLIAWWMSGFIGVAMLTPLSLMLATRPKKGFMILQRPLEAAAVGLAAITLTLVAWHSWVRQFDTQTYILLLVPLFIWSTVRLRQRGSALLALLIYGIDLALAHQGVGQLAGLVKTGWDLWLLGILMTLCGQFVAVMFNERSQVEQELRASEERQRLSQNYGGIGTWEVDFASHQLTASDNCYRMLGLPTQKNPTWEDFLSVVHPEDRSTIITNTANAYIRHKSPFVAKYRVTTKDDQVRWMQSTGQVERDTDGKPLRMLGVVEEITSQRQLAQSLQESEKRYRALLEDASDAILVADMDGNLEEINHAGERLLFHF